MLKFIEGVETLTKASKIRNVLPGTDPTDVITMQQFPYTKYVALLTQSGTDAPTAVVLENTTGQQFTWTYSGVGEYAASGNFVVAKSAFLTGGINGAGHLSGFFTTSTANVNTYDTAGAAANNSLNNSTIEIRLYK